MCTTAQATETIRKSNHAGIPVQGLETVPVPPVPTGLLKSSDEREEETRRFATKQARGAAAAGGRGGRPAHGDAAVRIPVLRAEP